jgi:peptide/nickel transport system ATP-binding protein
MDRGRAVLEVKNLSVSFSRYSGIFSRADLDVITDLSLTVREGEIVAVIGASGSGKSLLAHAVLGILPDNAVVGGSLEYRGEALTEERLEKLRGGEIVLVPQGVTYLDPLMKVGKQLEKGGRGKKTAERVSGALARFGLGENTRCMYPFQLSGGMARRVLIASAAMEEPRLIVADEPTPGLHMEVAKRVMGHFREIAAGGAGVLMITHDLELAISTADRIVVFYAGKTVEEASASDFDNEKKLRHPYTKALYRALPANGFEAPAGTQPYPGVEGVRIRARPRHGLPTCEVIYRTKSQARLFSASWEGGVAC